jgi:hypothetical protein
MILGAATRPRGTVGCNFAYLATGGVRSPTELITLRRHIIFDNADIFRIFCIDSSYLFVLASLQPGQRV